MNGYSLILPRRILFGEHVSEKLCAELPANAARVLIVAGNHAASDGTAEHFASLIRESGRECHIISGISAEPPLEDVDRVIEAGRAMRAPAVVSVGGGSVIDTAKAAAAIIPLDGSCTDYFSGAKTIPGKGAFFAALPTTAGTGAEMTKNSVLTEKATKVKKSLRSPFMTADAALVDPVLTYSCPKSLTAASGLDAFVQAAEGYINPAAGACSKSLALTALHKIFFSLRTAYAEPENAAARSDMAEGSMLAGMAFAPCGLGAVHGLAHPAGSLLHIPHGISCAVLMPYVFEYNLPAAGELYADLAKAIGLNTAAEFVDAAKRLAQDLNVPETFRDYGLTREHFAFILKNCRSASMKSNPRFMPDDDVLALLEKLL